MVILTLQGRADEFISPYYTKADIDRMTTLEDLTFTGHQAATYNGKTAVSVEIPMGGEGGGSVLHGTEPPDSGIGVNGTIYVQYSLYYDAPNLLSEELLDLSAWMRNMPTVWTFTDQYADGINTIVLRGGSGYEQLYTDVMLPAGTYNLSFIFRAPNGYSVINDQRGLAVMPTSYNPASNTGSGCWDNSSRLARTNRFNNAASDTGQTYSCTFTLAQETTVRLVFNLGGFADNVNTSIVISDIKIQDAEWEPEPEDEGVPVVDAQWIKLAGVWTRLG